MAPRSRSRARGFSRRSALLSYVHARFNATRVAGVGVTTSELRCVAPAHASGLVSVEVTQNEQQYTGGSARFEYEDAGAYSVEPAMGPVRGGTLVVVRGSPRVHGAAGGVVDHGAWCRFGGAGAVGASFDGDGSVRCVAPAAEGGGAVSVRVAVEGGAVVAAG